MIEQVFTDIDWPLDVPAFHPYVWMYEGDNDSHVAEFRKNPHLHNDFWAFGGGSGALTWASNVDSDLPVASQMYVGGSDRSNYLGRINITNAFIVSKMDTPSLGDNLMQAALELASTMVK